MQVNLEEEMRKKQIQDLKKVQFVNEEVRKEKKNQNITNHLPQLFIQMNKTLNMFSGHWDDMMQYGNKHQ